MRTRLDIVDRLQKRLLEIVATALPLIASSARDADLPGLTHLRDEMVEVIASYKRHADRTHAAAVDNGNAAAIAATRALCGGCTHLEQAYDEFRVRWAHRHAVEHWAEYRLSAIRMMKLLRNHVLAAREERTVPSLSKAA